MTYAQVEREAMAFAEALAGLGVRPGDRLAVDLPNWPEWVVTLLAAAFRSVVLVPLDPSLTAHELKYQLRHAEVRSEERRVGKEWRTRWSPDHRKKQTYL